MIRILRHIDPAILAVSAGCLVLLLIGGAVSSNFLAPAYLLQQVQIAAYLGIIAAGATLVVLLGHIDLSVPAALTAIAVLTTTVAGLSTPGLAALALPAGLACGALIGLVNGLGVALFRLPSMVWTLAVNAMLVGAVVFFTGGFKPKGAMPPLLAKLALGNSLGLPNAFWLWLLVIVVMAILTGRSSYGRALLAAGNSEKAVYLSGIRVRGLTLLTFVLAGLFTALGAMLLAGYANQAYQGMGDPYLMPVISAVVLGGTSILGGRGGYAGTVAGALFITLLSSILSVLQMPEAVRQITFGLIILGMLLARRGERRNA